MKKIILLLTTSLVSTYVLANENLRVDNNSTVGRLTYFKGNGEYSYYLPSAFKTELECFPVRCYLRILNKFSDEENQKIQDMGPSVALSDNTYGIVNSVNESILWIDDLASTKTKFLNTLAPNLPGPYFNTAIQLPTPAKGDELKKLYKTDGLGKYKVRVDLNATSTSIFLAITNPAELKKRLLALGDQKIHVGVMSSTIRNTLKGLAVTSIGLSDPDKDAMMYSKILTSNYLKKTMIGTYQVQPEAVRQISDTQELILDDTTTNIPYLCEVTLDIKEDSVPTTICSEKK